MRQEHIGDVYFQIICPIDESGGDFSKTYIGDRESDKTASENNANGFPKVCHITR